MHTSTFARAPWIVVALLAATGCDQLEAVDEGDGGTGGGAVIPPAVQAAFDKNCAIPACHDAGTRSQGLSLAAGDSAALLEGQLSAGGLPLVTIGDLEASYLAQKMLPNGEYQGGRMPTLPNLQDDPGNALILGWIAGADVSLDEPEE